MTSMITNEGYYREMNARPSYPSSMIDAIAYARMPALAEFARVSLERSIEPANGFPCPRKLEEITGGTPIGYGYGMLNPKR